MLPALLTVAVCAVLALVLVPMMRVRIARPEGGSFDQAVYRDQLRELDRDVARGVLNDTEAASARLEIQRRLLAAGAMPVREARVGGSPIAAVAIALVVAAGSAGLYLWIGAPTVPDMPITSRKIAADAPDLGADHVNLREAASRLKTRLDSNPSDGESWLLYARTTAMMDQWEVAGGAYKRAIDLGQKSGDIYASYGEMLVLQARGIVTPTAQIALSDALANDPKNDVARYYLALAAGQGGDAGKAIDMLQGLLADLPADSSMRDEIGKRIAEAATAAGMPVPPLAQGKVPAEPAPAAGGTPDSIVLDAAAQMSEGARNDLIRSMVARLAARLEASPNDLDGWMQLGRAYAVLGDGEKAVDAYDRASALKPNDMGIPLQAVATLLDRLKPEDPLPVRAIALLRKVEIADPDQPEVLWYLGIAAARDSKPDVARQSWTRLLTKLPADGEDAKMVKDAMASLPK